MARQHICRDPYSIDFKVEVGRVRDSEQAIERGTMRPVFFRLWLRDAKSDSPGVSIAVSDQTEIDLKISRAELEQLLENYRETLFQRALEQVEPLRIAQQEEHRANERIGEILETIQ